MMCNETSFTTGWQKRVRFLRLLINTILKLPAVCCEAESHPSQNSQLNFYPWIFLSICFYATISGSLFRKACKRLSTRCFPSPISRPLSFPTWQAAWKPSRYHVTPQVSGICISGYIQRFLWCYCLLTIHFFLTQSFNRFGIREYKNGIKVFANFLSYSLVICKVSTLYVHHRIHRTEM